MKTKDVFDWVRTECLLPRLQVEQKDQLLEQLAAAAKRCHVLRDISEQDIADGLKRRESLGSTGFGNGIAIPHCRLPGAPDFVVGMATIPDGIDFDALDDEPVRLALFIVGPDDENREHIRVLSTLSQILNRPGIADALMHETSAEGLAESFLRTAPTEARQVEDDKRSLFHVFVQKEDFFRSILQIFNGLPDTTCIVMDAENSSAYLSRLPMFAGFWGDNPRSFSRLLVAPVPKNLTNETVRQIEQVVGDLKSCEGLMVAIESLHFCAGRLTA